tara:strand:+ start:316 stop:537 length:222 start_codon:yes stop_codon:yes gene_type:complete
MYFSNILAELFVLIIQSGAFLAIMCLPIFIFGLINPRGLGSAPKWFIAVFFVWAWSSVVIAEPIIDWIEDFFN